MSVLRYRGDKTVVCTPAYIKNKFGIKPAQYADFKSLTGDVSDNIKGADKVGPKTAASLLNEFGDLKGILESTENIKKAFIKESLSKNAERLITNYKMIKLDNTAPLPFAFNELVYEDSRITTNEVMKGIGLRK